MGIHNNSGGFLSDIPEMIPPCDYPCSEVEPVEYGRRRFYRTQMLSVEGEEIKRLTEFHRAFTEYLRDRWNVNRSFEVLKAYRAVSSYYNADGTPGQEE